MSHAHAQLRLARTHERIEIEIEIDFPVRGVGQAGLAPPNSRYRAGGAVPPRPPASIHMHICISIPLHCKIVYTCIFAFLPGLAAPADLIPFRNVFLQYLTDPTPCLIDFTPLGS